jgi:hypothetical protein
MYNNRIHHLDSKKYYFWLKSSRFFHYLWPNLRPLNHNIGELVEYEKDTNFVI